MSFWALISNIGTIIALGKSLVGLVHEVAEKKAVPDCAHTDLVLANLTKIFQKKLINTVGDDKNQNIADALNQIREQFKCPAQ